MKLRKLFAVLMLSVFCLSGCSDRYRDVIEKDMKTEQTTTASASGDKTSESDKKDEEKKTEAVDTSDFMFTSTPSSEQTNSITKIVSFCKMLANQ